MNVIYVDGLSSRVRTALKEDGRVTEIIYEPESSFQVGNIYAARVVKVLKDQFIFLEIGDKRTAFLQPDRVSEAAIYNDRGKIALKEGDCLPVQIIKPAVDEKGAVVTTRLTLSGKYCVLIVNDTGIGVSRKIGDEEVRNSLKALGGELLPENMGLVMRTCCESAAHEEITQELESLISRAKKLMEKSAYIKPPALIYEEISSTARAVRDLSSLGDTQVVVNTPELYNSLTELCDRDRLTIYKEKEPMFHYYSIESAIEKALHRRIWLKSGGYLVIDYTEAMNVIDVNSGKMTGKHMKDFALKVNLEAAEEIARQIRLRNLNGMIIIDFVDMNSREDIKKVSEKLKECIARDRITTNLVGMTSLGLMQLTRKKSGLPLYKILMGECACCKGTGMVENGYYIVEKLLDEIRSLMASTIYNRLTVSCGKDLMTAIKDHIQVVKNIEAEFAGEVIFKEIKTFSALYYRIDRDVVNL